MTLDVGHIQPIVALIAGVLILLVPNLLSYIVAFYLIIVVSSGWGSFTKPSLSRQRQPRSARLVSNFRTY
jgi:Protein of unknown function (DUF3096)